MEVTAAHGCEVFAVTELSLKNGYDSKLYIYLTTIFLKKGYQSTCHYTKAHKCNACRDQVCISKEETDRSCLFELL